MKSMTGYGWGECSKNGFKITVELSSVNRKQSEISINLPRELEVLEAQVRDEVNRKVARGRVTARVILHAGEGQETARVRVNTTVAKTYARELRQLAKELKINDFLTLDHLVRAPGVFETNDEVGDAEAFWPSVNEALQLALTMLVKMRSKEGANLKKDLCERMATMRKAVARVRKEAPQVQKRYRDMGAEPARLAQPEFVRHVQAEAKRWADAAQAGKVTIDD